MKYFILFILMAVALVAAPNTPISNPLLQNRIAATSETTTYAATTNIDLTKGLQTVTLTGNITFTTSNRAAGVYVTVRVVGDGSNRTLVFPSWKFVGTVAPNTLVANKVAILTLICFGSNDTDIVASWVSEP